MKEVVIPYELMDLNTYINNNRANRMKGAKSKRAYTRLCALSVKAAINQGLEIKEDEDALSKIKEMGFQAVPVIVTETENWYGFQPDKLAKLER